MDSMNDFLKGLGEMDCYQRVYVWIKNNAKRVIQEKQASQEFYKGVIHLADAMPKPIDATSADRDVVFSEVLQGYFEDFFTVTDEHGIQLSEYARHALSKKYAKGLQDEGLSANVEKSALYLYSSTKAVKGRYTGS